MLVTKAEFLTSVNGCTCLVPHWGSYQAMPRGMKSF